MADDLAFGLHITSVLEVQELLELGFGVIDVNGQIPGFGFGIPVVALAYQPVSESFLTLLS